MSGIRRFPMNGVEVWKNPKNKFFVFQLHYSANPVKCDPSYREGVRSGMPIRQYMQEYELQWDSFAGTPVYTDFKKLIHGSKERIYPEIGLPLLRGWDFGLTPACVIAQLVGNQLRVLKEFVATNKGADQFSQEVLKQCAILYPKWSDRKRDWRDFIDPAGAQRKDTDMGTCAGILAAEEPKGRGLIPIPGPVAWEPRRTAVESFLTKIERGVACFQIDLERCPVLVRGFEGGYRYPEKSFEEEPSKIRPIKDEHSHPHDALQYICAGANKLRKPLRKPIPAPSYSSSAHTTRTADPGPGSES